MISIVIPAYNRAAALQSCIESIMQQAYAGLEVIVIDDGSSDGTVELLQQLKKKYVGITVIINPGNFGVNYSRNRGIERASGKFILFLDSDDRLAPGALEAIRNATAAHASTEHFLFLVSDRKEEFAHMKEATYFKYANWLQGTIGGDFIHMVAAGVMKKYLFFEQFRMYEYLNWLRVFKATTPQLLVPFIVAERERGRADSLTTASRLKNFSVIKGKFESQQLYYTLYHKDLQYFQSKALTRKLLGAIMLGVACNRKKECHRLVQYGSRLSIKLAGSLILLFPPALMRSLIIVWSSLK